MVAALAPHWLLVQSNLFCAATSAAYTDIHFVPVTYKHKNVVLEWSFQFHFDFKLLTTRATNRKSASTSMRGLKFRCTRLCVHKKSTHIKPMNKSNKRLTDFVHDSIYFKRERKHIYLIEYVGILSIVVCIPWRIPLSECHHVVDYVARPNLCEKTTRKIRWKQMIYEINSIVKVSFTKRAPKTVYDVTVYFPTILEFSTTNAAKIPKLGTTATWTICILLRWPVGDSGAAFSCTDSSYERHSWWNWRLVGTVRRQDKNIQDDSGLQIRSWKIWRIRCVNVSFCSKEHSGNAKNRMFFPV